MNMKNFKFGRGFGLSAFRWVVKMNEEFETLESR